MNIGIDARMYGPSVGGGGLGRYVEQLVGQLAQQNTKNRYVLFVLNTEQAKTVEQLGFEAVVTNIHWYGLREQISLPKIIDSYKLDLIHFPHWNVPLKLETPFVVTIHDLILLEEPLSAKATTRHPLIYGIKYRLFKMVLRHALTASKKIIAVSNYTKSSINRFYPNIAADKIEVVYEGLTPLSSTADSPNTSIPPKPYFLYVGNAYPHKNLESLLHAFSFFHKLHPNVHLVLAGRHDVFYERLKKELDEIDVPNTSVTFVKNPSDSELATLYRNATLYLFPSRSEGFGLPPLEAMSFGIPVAASNTSSLPEILGDAALYFAPDDIEKMVEIMEQTLEDESLRKHLTQKGSEQIKKYSWKQMTQEIQTIYKNCG
ncbi:glycosyltransferase family 4 protein [Candidatus Uhrbacteria bacterium]|jgi:glycosyltransferase involved in cell wall biosynthesis|nr:glycosyltransferase family 4 protein [Candidatus Uhrbacteria bacterium]